MHACAHAYIQSLNKLLSLTYSTVPTVTNMAIEDDAGVWQALPYEIAAAFVRTLAIHCHELHAAKLLYAEQKEKDESESKPDTIKAKDSYMKLRSHDRFIIMNARTHQLATQDWVTRHIQANEAGVPVWKKDRKGRAPWIMTLRYCAHGVSVDLSVRLTQGDPLRKLRCFDLRNQVARDRGANLMQGYEHLLNHFDDASGEEMNDENDGDEESSETQFGDEMGLEGWFSH